MIQQILKKNGQVSFEEKVRIYNEITQQLYDFIGLEHPALNVQLVPIDHVEGNDYNPNKVAPPEMRLLELSIRKDGLTMPVVVASEKKNKNWTVVDGFHRTAVFPVITRRKLKACLNRSNIEPATLPGTGTNNLSAQYSPSINLDYAAGLFLNNGSSDFSGYNNPQMMGYIMPLVPFMMPTSYMSLSAENNYWHSYSPFSPEQYVDYNMLWLAGGATDVKLEDWGNSRTAPPSISCPSLPLGDVGTITGGQPSFLINKPTHNNGTAFEAARDLMYLTDPPNYTAAFDELESILLYSYDMTPEYYIGLDDGDSVFVSELEQWQDVINFSYTRMVECVTQAVATGQLEAGSYSYNTYVDRVIDAQNYILGLTGYLNNTKYRFYTDRAMLYRLGGDHTTATNTLAMISWGLDTYESNLLDYNYCMIDKERKMISDELTKADYYSSVNACYMELDVAEYGIPSPQSASPDDEFFDGNDPGPMVIRSAVKEVKQEANRNNNNNKELLVYPNPAQDMVYIKTPGIFSKAIVELFDIAGKRVLHKEVAGSNDLIALPLDLEAGTYIVVLSADNETMKRSRLIISK